MSQSADAAIDRWRDIVTGRTKRGPLTASNIMVRGDLLYSYGSHFELARPLRDGKGEITAYLLNGDTYSVTTSTHQSHVRNVLAREPQPAVIIPHSALNSAGVDLDSVRIVHVKEDTWTTTKHRTTEQPPRSKWVNHPVYADRRLTEAEVNEILDKKHAEAMQEYNRSLRYRDEAIAEGNEVMAGVWTRSLERLGGAPVRPDKLPESAMTKRYVASYDRKLHRDGREWGGEIDVVTLPDGTVEYRWDTTRHWLGEALIKARVTWVSHETCADCGGKGARPGIGDRWANAQWCETCHGDRSVRKLHHRWSYYLSGFDHEEARPLYFFAELPRGAKPETVEEAYEALKPDPVKVAEQMNRPIFRQGDIFGVPLEAMDRKQLKALKARVVRRKVPPIPEGQTSVTVTLPYVLNTNHTATEVAYLPGGVTLARGTMYHDPEGRRADHARRRIGDGKSWHVVVKNTVPIARRR